MSRVLSKSFVTIRALNFQLRLPVEPQQFTWHLKAAGVKKDDIVLCQSFTFSATANPIIYEGAIPVFIDSRSNRTWNIDLELLEQALIELQEQSQSGHGGSFVWTPLSDG
jgi:hypothetical protein